MARNEAICIGDYITLFAAKPNEGWLGFEGVFGANCFVSSNPNNFEDCIWQVHIQHQYSAVAEYNENFLQTNLVERIETDSVVDSLEHNDLAQQLSKAALNEIRLNEKLMAMKIGKPIAFGDTIQLMHVKSGKFLNIDSQHLAKEEKENMQVSVKLRGDSMSYLSFSPRYKYDKDGQLILNHLDVCIKVQERPGEYLHAAKKSSINKNGEVNCSLDYTSWTVSLYYQYKVLKDPNRQTILGGQLVSLQDVESLACLSSDLNFAGRHEGEVILSTSYLLSEDTSTRTVASNLLWVIEKEKLSDGGEIRLGDDLITLKHLNSNLYLKEEDGGLSVVLHRENASFFTFHNSLLEGGNVLVENMTVNITQGDLWINAAVDERESSCNNQICDCTETAKQHALSFLITTSRAKVHGNDLYLGVETTSYLRFFEYQSSILSSTIGGNMATINQSFGQTIKNAFQYLDNIYEIFLFVSDDLAGQYDTYLNKYISKEVNHRRQILFREQGLIDAILDLIEYSTHGYYDNVQLKRNNQTTNNKTNNSIGSDSGKSSAKNIRTIVKANNSNGKINPIDVNTSELLESDNPNETSFLTRIFLPFRRGSISSKDSHNYSSGTKQRNSGLIDGSHLQMIQKNRKKINPTSQSKDNDEASDELDTSAFISKSSQFKSSSSNMGAQNQLSSPLSSSSLKRSTKIRFSIANMKLNTDVNSAIMENDLEKSSMTITQELVNKLLLILFELIRNNFDNQLHVSNRLDILIHQVHSQELAVSCILELLYDNIQILQTRVFQKEINMFLDLLVDSKLNASYMRLISTLCKAPKGVDSTQRMISSTLFKHFDYNSNNVSVPPNIPSRYKHLTFNINANYDNITPQVWNNPSIYFPIGFDRTSLGNDVFGFNLYLDGLPAIIVSWDFDAFRTFSTPIDLYGAANNIDLATICKVFSSSSNTSTKQSVVFMARRQSSFRSLKVNKGGVAKRKGYELSDMKSQVYNYLIAQLYLVADVCLDRNYVSINILQKGYNFDMLLAILKYDNILSEIKAPACRIIRCMYVDREPQVKARYPRLIRIAATIRKDISNNFSKSDEMSPVRFAILQCIISEYLHKHASLSLFNEYSVEITQLLDDLLKFGFYTSDEHIYDIINPLIKIIEPKNLQVGQVSEDKDEEPSIFDYFNFFGSNWENKYLQFYDSIYGMMFFLTVVIITVSVAVAQIAMDNSSSSYTKTKYEIFDLTVSIFFLFDIALRIYCHVKINSNIIPFFRVFFNFIDFVLVVLDMILLGLGSQSSLINSGRFFRIFKIIRLLRLLRLVRAARLVKSLADKSASTEVWSLPQRFIIASKYELDTKIRIVSILSKIYDRIHDKKLEYLVQAFVTWKENERNGVDQPPLEEIADSVITFIMSNSFSITSSLDNLLLDTIMYSNSALIKESLNLLMTHNSSKELILNLSNQVQIIYSPIILQVHNALCNLLKELKSAGEMYEVWADLSTPEFRETGEKMLKVTESILSYTRRISDNYTLDIKAKYIVDVEVQMFLHNLDFMDIAINSLVSLYDGGRDQLSPLVSNIMIKICDLICWFVRDNLANQNIAYKHFQWFLDRIDDLPLIQSSRVIREILRGNRDLVKQFPRTLIGKMAMNILNKGHNPDYLDMYLGLVGYDASLDNRYLPIENEIAKYLTGREWKAHIILYCCGPNNSNYAKRKSYMEIYSDDSLSHYDLPNDLKYHISLVKVLARCRLGPKLQAIYNFDDILRALIDPATIILVKIPLVNLLNDYITTDINQVKLSEYIWPFFDSIHLYFEGCMQSLPLLLCRTDKDAMNIRLNVSSWLHVIFRTLDSYFAYFNFASYNSEIEAMDSQGLHKNRRNDEQILATLLKLYRGLKSISQIKGLGSVFTETLNQTAKILESAIKTDPSYQEGAIKLDLEAEDTLQDLKPAPALQSNHSQASGLNHHRNLRQVNQNQRDSLITIGDVQQEFSKRQFDKFMNAIFSNRRFVEISSSAETISLFEKIPSELDSQTSEVRLEPLISKISQFIRSNIKKTLINRSLDIEIFDITFWLLKSFRELLEKKLNFSIDLKEITLNIPEHFPESFEAYRKIFSQNGLVELCIDLIGNGIPQKLSQEALKLLIILLCKPGGCVEVQRIIFNILSNSDSTVFFDYIVDTIEDVKVWVQKSTESKFYQKEKNSVTVPNSISIFFLLQVLCDGSELALSNYLREQKNNYKNVKIIDTLSNFADYLSRYENPICTFVSIHVLSSIIKMLRGPCVNNQEEFVLKTELLVSLNRYIRLSKPSLDSFSNNWNNALESLRECIVEVLLTAIAGQPKHSVVFDKITSTIEFVVFSMILLPSEQDIEIKGFVNSTTETLDYQYSNAQRLYLVFINTLGQEYLQFLPPYIPLRHVYKIDILWHDKLETVSFYLPSLLYDASVDKINEDIHAYEDITDESESNEQALKDVMITCRRLYKEALHQRFLDRFGIPDLLRIKYWTTWLMFGNAIVMNIMLLKYFSTHEIHHDSIVIPNIPTYSPTPSPSSSSNTDDKFQNYHILSQLNDEIFIDESADIVLSVLNIIQIFLVLIVILTYVVSCIPVSFNLLRESGLSEFNSVIRVIINPVLIWYFCYLLLTLIAIKYHRLFLSGLLLDWVALDSTSRDVLKSVQSPARQLLATLIIILILLNMFAGIVFYEYRQDVMSFDISNMWESLKLCISYGIRGEYGISHEMYNTLGPRIALDLIFYFIIMAILRHIFFAIIVDTFKKFRELKYEHNLHSHNICFICGIERHEFEKKNSNAQINAFSNHRKTIHNPVHYFFYMVYIWEKSLNDDHGIDMYVRECLAKGDMSWFPIGISSDIIRQNLDGSHENESEHLKLLDSDKEALKDKDLFQKLAIVQSQLSKLSEKSSGDTSKGSKILDTLANDADTIKAISAIYSSISTLQAEVRDLANKVNSNTAIVKSSPNVKRAPLAIPTINISPKFIDNIDSESEEDDEDGNNERGGRSNGDSDE